MVVEAEPSNNAAERPATDRAPCRGVPVNIGTLPAGRWQLQRRRRKGRINFEREDPSLANDLQLFLAVKGWKDVSDVVRRDYCVVCSLS